MLNVYLLLSTLVYQIDVQDEISVQEGKFSKNIKRAGQNKHAGRKNFSKSINVQTKIRLCRGDFFPQKHYQTTPNGHNKKISKAHPKYFQSTPKSTPKTLPNHSQTGQNS